MCVPDGGEGLACQRQGKAIFDAVTGLEDENKKFRGAEQCFYHGFECLAGCEMKRENGERAEGEGMRKEITAHAPCLALDQITPTLQAAAQISSSQQDPI